MKKKFFITVFCVLGLLMTAGHGLFAQNKSDPVESDEEGLKARCSTNADCSRPGMLGVCQAPGEKTSRCLWQEIIKVPMIVIEPRGCRSCQTATVIKQLQMLFPGLDISYLKADEQKAKELIAKTKITMLPAFIVSKDAEREPGFVNFQKIATFADGQYLLKPEFSGVSFFLDRKKEPKRLDLFVVLTSPGMYHAVKIAEDIKKKKAGIAVQVHFLGIEDAQTKEILSPGDEREPAEEKVYACVEKHYLQKASEYLIDRIMTGPNIWLEDDLRERKFDVDEIKKCAQGLEGEKLLREKIRLSQELNLHYAPLFLMENVEIFGVSEETTADEIMGLIKPEQKK